VLADADPVLKLFTWLTNLGALGVLLLMAVTSFAVVAFFNRRPDLELGAWSTKIAPLISGIALVVILVLGVANFNVLITGLTDAPTDTMTVVLPIVLFGSGILGMAVAAWMRAARPTAYAEIGERTPTEVAEHVA
jgi:hypothetical protein